MRNVTSSVTLTILALSVLGGCGLENSVVGGGCRDGMVVSGHACVAPDGTNSSPTDPSPELANGTPAQPAGIVPAAASSVALPGPAIPASPSAPTDAPVVNPVPPVDPTPPITPVNPIIPNDPVPPVDPIPPVDPVPPVDPIPPAPLECDAPLVACHGVCIAVDSDGANCGACAKACASNICSNSECLGATPGDVVLIGHDYASAVPGSAQAKVLVNALSIPSSDPIRVLSYEDGASTDAVAQARALAIAGIHGRSVSFTVAEGTAALRSGSLSRSYDVVLIHDASGLDAPTVGASWSESLGGFASKGGVVVALDRGTSPIPELLTSSGLLTVASHTQLPLGAHLFVTAAADVVGSQVLSPYATFGVPVSFQGIAAPGDDLAWVVRQKTADVLSDPVVVHRTVR